MPTDYLFAQSEVISKKLPEFFGRWDVASNLIKKAAKVDRIGERDYRSNFLTQDGGRSGTYSPAGGALGRGTAAKGSTMIGTFFSLRRNYELQELAVKATAESQVSQLNALKRAMKTGLPNFAQFVDQAWHSDRTAVIATATAQATVSSKTVYTMDTTTGVQLLERGQYVQVYDNALANLLGVSGGTLPVAIEQIDYENRKVYLSGLIASAGNTDKLCFDGVSGASPLGLNGLYYFNNYALTGYTLGVNRATELELVTNSVDAAGVPTPMKGLQLWHKILKRRKEVPKDLVLLVPPDQQANLFQNVLNIANVDLSKGSVSDDLIPEAKLKWRVFGLPAYLDVHQRSDRIDAIIPSLWSRMRLADVGFHEVGNVRFFTLYDSGGSPAATLWFGLTVHEDYICHNPGAQGVIYGCTAASY